MAKKMIRPLHSEADYDVALNEIERYFENEPKPGTPEADRFDLLALIIEDYERKRWPIEPPDTIDAIRYRMAAFGANIPKWRATIDEDRPSRSCRLRVLCGRSKVAASRQRQPS
jgi:antitoxin component HigA of HigAB toxin-antitoxin module